MKTPRELLLEHHREAEASLDRIRSEVCREWVGAGTSDECETAPSCGGLFAVAWQELFVACRRWWLTLGAAWCLVVLLTVIGESGRSDGAGVAVRPGYTMELVREQQELRRELLGLTSVEAEVDPPRHRAPGARSDVSGVFVCV